MQENDLNLLLDAVNSAGEIAVKFFRNNPKVWEKGSNEGPVTEADIEINNNNEMNCCREPLLAGCAKASQVGGCELAGQLRTS